MSKKEYILNVITLSFIELCLVVSVTLSVIQREWNATLLLSVLLAIHSLSGILMLYFESKKETVDICDSCGKNHKAQNSQICKECQDKIKE